MFCMGRCWNFIKIYTKKKYKLAILTMDIMSSHLKIKRIVIVGKKYTFRQPIYI